MISQSDLEPSDPHNGYLLIAEAVTYVAPETQLAPLEDL